MWRHVHPAGTPVLKLHWKISDLGVGVLCVVSGVGISVLPHLIEWVRNGNPVWLADHDEVDLYLVIASHAYHRHAAYLTDPNCAGSTSYLPWLLIIPGVLATKVMGLAPIYIGMVWRVIGGAGIGLAWYFIFRSYFTSKLAVLMLTLFALCDSGVFDGRPLIAHAMDVVRIQSSSVTLLPHDSLPKISGLWRIITPALSWPFLLVYVWLLGRAVRNHSTNSAILAGVGLGVCFSYFYYWTAAIVGLGLAAILDRSLWRTYLVTGLVGAVIGIPFLIAGLHLKGAGNPDWLHRTDHFLPIGHFDELLVPKVAIGLVILAFPWVLRRDRSLIFLWALCVSALLLGNQQVISGFQFENWHWHYVWGPTLWLLIILIGARLFERITASPRFVVAATVAVAITVASSFWMRGVETIRSLEAVTLSNRYREFAPEFGRVAEKLRSGAVISGEPAMVSLLSIANDDRPIWGYSFAVSSCVDDREWNRRIAADAYYTGLDRDAFEKEQEEILDLNHWGPCARSGAMRDAVLEERLSDFDEVAANPEAIADRYQIEYVILPTSAADGHVSKQWQEIISGPSWRAWRREKGLAG